MSNFADNLKNENSHSVLRRIIYILLAAVLLTGCAETKYVPDGRYLLDEVQVSMDGKYRDLSTAKMKSYVRQQNNARWFSVAKLPLMAYSLSGRDTTRWMNRLLRNMGEPPVLYDSAMAVQTCSDLQQMMRNSGYLNGRVELWTRTKGKKLKAVYKLFPGAPYYIGDVDYVISDPTVRDLLMADGEQRRELKSGQQFVVDNLDKERKRITTLLNNRGYYRFHKEYIRYEADTVGQADRVNLKLLLSADRTEDGRDTLHTRYRVRHVGYDNGVEGDSDIHIRRRVLTESTYIRQGGYYSGSDLQNTYNHFGRLGAVKYTNIGFTQLPDTALLDCRIQVQTNKPSTLSFQPEGTNTAGDLGAAATLTYQNRNLFRGAENLSVELRGAYEAIKGLEGYSNQDFVEYSLETRLKFPRFVMPFVSYDLKRRINATSEVALLYDLQDRPEFHRRLLSASWRYKWTPQDRNYQYQLDMLDLNYVFMPWISDTFRRLYLDDVSSRNAILSYNYKDLFITKIGFGFAYNNGRMALKTNIETSGNVLDAVSGIFGATTNDLGQNLVFNIAYAQ